MTTKKKISVPASAGKVMFRYIPKRVHGITDPKHILYDGKLDSSIDTFYVHQNSSGRWSVDMTDAEKEWVKEGLNLSDGALNTKDRHNEYLNTFMIEMPKHGLSLNTTDPEHFLIEKILMGYTNIFAPSSSEKLAKRSYRYVRLKESDETKVFLQEQDVKKRVYKLLGKLEENREQMVMFILNNKVRLNPKIDTKDLRKLVNISADKDPGAFISTLEDPLFVEKGLINMAVILKVIEIKSGFYYFDDQPLSFEGDVATLNNAAIYLADKTNGDIKLGISNKVLDEFNGIK